MEETYKEYAVHTMGSRACSYLFKVAVLAGPLLCVLVVNDVQRSLSLFQLQTFDLRLQLIQLLLQVLALFHVLHPEHRRRADEETDSTYTLICNHCCRVNYRLIRPVGLFLEVLQFQLTAITFVLVLLAIATGHLTHSGTIYFLCFYLPFHQFPNHFIHLCLTCSPSAHVDFVE